MTLLAVERPARRDGLFVVAGTGSRTLQTADSATKWAVWDATWTLLEPLAAEHGDRLVLMTGMAEGFDHLLAKLGFRHGVAVWAAVPNSGYGRHYWGRESQTGQDQFAEFEDILRRCWRVTHVMEDVHGVSGRYLNGRHSNAVRNTWMVEQADRFLVWNPTTRGTAGCLKEITAARVLWDEVTTNTATAVDVPR
jgi:hypothetical protein